MKGNPTVIEALNKALRLELTAVNQYWLHYRLTEDWGYGKLAKKERAESIEEMHHADKLVARIIFLEGFPNMQQLDPLVIGQNIKEVLEADLQGEYAAQKHYSESRSLCQEVGDYVSMALFDDAARSPQRSRAAALRPAAGRADQRFRLILPARDRPGASP